ncbi:hypothetical protein [Vibrio barjaei]|jgi:hypothetical protein|uniref:Uncharacterized protein n=1 Tax=Vibrio barjaei TaxID=1676683 RepID=A0ABW7III6_9VIBR|nr:hypothetical protein [Vibrio barjaei]MCG9787131.1 hypothetical protein [Vibrio mediterranei]MCY9873311.1 hypothetical protein [Vibrio barjaei]OIN25709.1 hypothetical protein AWH66_2015650 [Vibrio barjaei]
MKTAFLTICCLVIVGCANDAPLGHSVAKVRHAQTYDHGATARNKDVIPTGTGARMQVAYDAYVDQSAYDGEAEKVLGKDLVKERTTAD